MDRLIKVLRGNRPISDKDASDSFSLLIPIIETDPAAPDAIEAARSIIRRCVPGEDTVLASVLDWWLVATTGRTLRKWRRPSAAGIARWLAQAAHGGGDAS